MTLIDKPTNENEVSPFPGLTRIPKKGDEESYPSTALNDLLKTAVGFETVSSAERSVMRERENEYFMEKPKVRLYAALDAKGDSIYKETHREYDCGFMDFYAETRGIDYLVTFILCELRDAGITGKLQQADAREDLFDLEAFAVRARKAADYGLHYNDNSYLIRFMTVSAPQMMEILDDLVPDNSLKSHNPSGKNAHDFKIQLAEKLERIRKYLRID